MKSFIEQYKEYENIEHQICTFYRKTIGCTQCPLYGLSCGIFDFECTPTIESVIEVLEKWKPKNETNN